jgi:hypothetical protein
VQTVHVVNSTISRNIAVNTRSTSCGGGVAMPVGGLLRLTGTAVVTNEAFMYGGGVFLGPSAATTAADVTSCQIAGNRAGGAGQQLYSQSGGHVVVSDSVLTLAGSGLPEVRVVCHAAVHRRVCKCFRAGVAALHPRLPRCR